MNKWMTCAVLVLLAASSVALAKPLPPAMKVALKKGKPFLTTQGVTVQLADNWDAWTEVKAELSDDGKNLELRYARCGMDLDPEEEPMRISVGVVDAKIENAKGMALHTKRKYKDSARLFEQAAAHDPATPLYATNWLAALVMSGDVAKANKLLEDGLGSKHFAWYAWRLAVDPELRKLKAQPGAKKFHADKPGKLTSKALGAESIAVSALGTTIALVTSDSSGAKFVSFVQLDTGKETLRLPLKQPKQPDSVLAAMGFDVSPTKLLRFEAADKLKARVEKTNMMMDVRAAAELGEHIVFVERTAGCDVSELDLHAGAIKP